MDFLSSNQGLVIWIENGSSKRHTVLHAVMLQDDLPGVSVSIWCRSRNIERTLAFTNAALAWSLAPPANRKYPGRVWSTSGSTPTELTGQSTPIRADIKAATSACSTSCLNKCVRPHGAEYSSCEEGTVSCRGPRTPAPHKINGVRVLSGSKEADA